MKDFTLAGFASFLAGVAAEAHHARREALEEAARIVEQEAKRVLGTYDYGWPELAESTQADRARQGYPPNEPLLRTGELRDSISHRVVSDHEAEVGSDSDIALYQELGTRRIPPRPFLSGAAAHEGDKVAKIIGRHVVKALVGEAVVGSIVER